MLGLTLYRFYRLSGYTVIVLSIMIGMLYCIAPLITPTPQRINDWIKQEFAYPTTIGEIQINFKGFSPEISLSQVKILTPTNESAIEIDKVKFTPNIFQLLQSRIGINKLIIQGGKTKLSYIKDILMVPGLPEYQFNLKEWNQNHQNNLVKRLIIQDSEIELILDNKTIPLTEFQLWVDNKSSTKIRGSTTALSAKPTKLIFGSNAQAKHSLHPHHNETVFYLESDSLLLEELAGFFPKVSLPSLKGSLAIKSWLSLKEGQALDFKAQFQLNHLEVKNPTYVLQSHFMRGAIHAQKNQHDWVIVGKDWQIQETPYSFLSKMPLAFKFIRSKQEEETKWELIAHDINIEKWLNWTKNLAFLPPSFTEKIEKYQPKGYLEYCHVGLKEKNQRWTPFLINTVFKEISSQSSDGEIAALSGSLVFDGQHGKCQLVSKNGRAFHPKLNAPIDFQDLSSLFYFQIGEQNWKIQGVIDSFNVNHIPLTGNFSLLFTKNKRLPQVEMLFQSGAGKVDDALALLPHAIMDQSLVKWLGNSIKNGEILNSKFVLRGDLAHFPFDKQQGLFALGIKLDKVDLHYYEGWPALNSLNADLMFHNRSLIIHGKTAEIEGGKLLDAKAIIPDLFVNDAHLTIDTEIANSLEKAINIIEKSPLQASLGKTLSPIDLKGEMTLSLGLIIPLSAKNSDNIKVKGVVGVENAQVRVKAADLNIEHLKGEVSFTDKSVQSDDLNGALFDHPTKFHIVSSLIEKNTDLQVQAAGHVKLDKLKQWLNIPANPMITGEADYEALVSISSDSSKPTELVVNSALGGIAINAPLPLAKPNKSRFASQCKIVFESADKLNISTQYGNLLNMAFKLGLKDKQWEVLGGNVSFGDKVQAQVPAEGLLLVDGQIKEMNLEDWKRFLTKDNDPHSGGIRNLKPQLDLKIENFNAYGASFANTRMMASWEAEKALWSIKFEGPSLSGHITLPNKESKEAIIANFDQLILIKSDKFNNVFSDDDPERPIFDIYIKKLIFNEKVFEKVEARFEPSWKGYYFPKIKAKFKRSELALSGQWDYLAPLTPVRMEGTILTKNIHHTLNILGLTSTLHKAKGNISFSLQWNGNPITVDYPTLTGYANFSLKQGYLYGVNPGMGRVLSLFNLDNMQRRLSLDFSDLTKDSIAFDALTGKFRFGKGKISTNNIVLKGPAAKIKAFGQADLESLDLKAEMIVMPNVTGSLPVAAAIAAGNPAVGAAVWVFDKVLGDKIQEIHQYRYKVMGSWSEPQIEEIPNYS